MVGIKYKFTIKCPVNYLNVDCRPTWRLLETGDYFRPGFIETLASTNTQFSLKPHQELKSSTPSHHQFTKVVHHISIMLCGIMKPITDLLPVSILIIKFTIEDGCLLGIGIRDQALIRTRTPSVH